MFKHVILVAALLIVALPAFGASCRINEYAYAGADANSVPMQIAREPAVAKQIVSFTTATSSAAFNAQTRLIRVVCDAQAYFVVSNDGSAATANSSWLESHSPEYFGVTPGFKISFYDGTS
jgi:hypothetical protein